MWNILGFRFLEWEGVVVGSFIETPSILKFSIEEAR